MLDFVVGNSNVTEQIAHIMNCLSTNLTASLIHVNELLETFREVETAVVAIKMSSIGELFEITETTRGLVSGSSWDGLRLWPD